MSGIAAGLADRSRGDVVDRVLRRGVGRRPTPAPRHGGPAGCSVATTIDSASTWKWRRSACRVSDMPKPSVPSEV